MKAFIFFLGVGFSAFAVNAALGEIENGFAHEQSDQKILTISVLDWATANSLFREFIQDKDIPFKYPIDGCYARATEMAKIAEDKKILMGRVYAEGILVAKTDSAESPVVVWGYHIATVAYVKSQKGDVELMVFDPSLFDKPVTTEMWKQRMLDRSSADKPVIRDFYYGSRFQYYRQSVEDNRESWSQVDLADARDMMKRYQPLQDLSSNREANAERPKAQGAK
ncbi:MAG: hypothetical protein COT73_03715 [Bdellovibrio sp. CG10_big_fil_rev_8_21_14_0_10_47_8]|nr:MAG: hypothetical protein COT73_03715 [Bdellovibrio sp. CG10_big_fil_rev_8_21_14_0_10_47_8]